MISPELLRRYPFFSQLNSQQLNELAMISDEVSLSDDEIVLQEGQPADTLYFLLEGSIDLYYTVEENYHREARREVPVCSINPGEVFGISTLIEPNVFTSTARSSGESRVIRLRGAGLQEIFAADSEVEELMLRRMAQAAIQRLHATRVQLAAAWS